MVDREGVVPKGLSSNIEESPKILIEWLLTPIKDTDFFENYWEQKLLHIRRVDTKEYFRHLFGSKDLNTMLHKNLLLFTRNVEIVQYCNGKGEVLNLKERAVPSAIWDYYSNGCTIRILNLQSYDDGIYRLLATLQERFGCVMKANLYLIPPDRQGQGPQWNDSEVFILQLEGQQRWKLYEPKSENQILARYPSHNLARKEVGRLEHIITLHEGDVLYIPRGSVHEASTVPNSHSLHIIISTYRNTSYADLLEKVLPNALKTAAETDLNFRKGLPLQYLKHVGAVSKPDNETKRKVVEVVTDLIVRLLDYIDVDVAADDLGRKFMHDSLPPVLVAHDEDCSVRGNGKYFIRGTLHNRIQFQSDTKIRLLRQFCLSVFLEGNKAKIYYNIKNSPIYHAEDEQFVDIDLNLVPAVSHLVQNFPNYVSIKELPIDDDALKLQIVSVLWDRGLLVTKNRYNEN